MTEKKIVSYEFGPYRLLPAERLFLRDGRAIALTPRVFDTLLTFVRNGGRLLSKDDLMRMIWRGTVVEEGNLTQNIFILRKTLGESPHDHQYLVTIPQQGYRFVARVREHYEEESAAGPARADEAGRGAGGEAVTSIAVMPFTLLGGTADGRCAGIGIADTLITKLSGIRKLVVRPTSAVLKYAEEKPDLSAVGRELRVEGVLDGTLQILENRLRVNVRLVNVESGLALWAGKFDDDYRDIFSVQDRIAEHVVQSLELELSGEERGQLAKSHTDNVEAYQLYVKGRFYWDQRTEQGLLRALDYVRRAIRVDPDYAPAYVGLADTYSALGEYLYSPPGEAFPRAKSAALKAREIDPTMAEAYASLAEVAFFYEWDWASAEESFRRAVELKRSYASGHHSYAWFLMAMGRLEEATDYFRQARKLNPGSLTLNTFLGLPLYYARQYEGALAQFRETLEMEPDFTQAHYYIASALTQLGRYEEAAAEYLRVIPVEYAQQASALLAYTYAASGREAAAVKVLGDLRELSQTRYVSPYLEAIVHAGLGQKEEALAKLGQACRERAAWSVFLGIDPFLDGLRADPLFNNLLRCVGLPPRPAVSQG
ncbi:MAG: tetratricopeptide repeat protein [Acidobacteria bacterium]|nr:tetratricopeptide repeat protein [Acidobacteriota bacterium]